MKKSLIILLLVFGVVALVGAQENNSVDLSKKECTFPRFKLSLNFGNALTSFYVPSWWNYSAIYPAVPSVSGVSEYSNSSVNMIGAEFRWMFKSNWSLNLSGLGVLKSNPSSEAIKGVYDSSIGQVIPDVESVPYMAAYNWTAELGVSHYFDLPNKRLVPYIGASFVMAQGIKLYEATLDVSQVDYYGNPIDPAYLDFLGQQSAEIVTWGFTLPIGAEYKVADGLFIGMSINAANYFYQFSTIRPGEGMELATAQNVTTSFFTRPMLKLGIEF